MLGLRNITKWFLGTYEEDNDMPEHEATTALPVNTTALLGRGDYVRCERCSSKDGRVIETFDGTVKGVNFRDQSVQVFIGAKISLWLKLADYDITVLLSAAAQLEHATANTNAVTSAVFAV